MDTLVEGVMQEYFMHGTLKHPVSNEILFYLCIFVLLI